MLPTELFGTARNLYWYKHKGQIDGSNSWEEPILVGEGWENYISVFAAGNNTIYAISPDGNLFWYKHTGQADGSKTWQYAKFVDGGGWADFVHVFSAGGDIIYAIDKTGNLFSYQHIGQAEGTPEWQPRTLISNGWHKYTRVFAATNTPFIYAIDSDGKLYWFEHVVEANGSITLLKVDLNSPGWNPYVSVFAAENESIYAVDATGKLYWQQHDGQTHGGPLGAPVMVGDSGWLMYRSVFAAAGGIIYGLGVDTQTWMSRLPLHTHLNQFVIPGTHDTGTWVLPEHTAGVLPNNAKCQTLSLIDQLNAGIRFIDIRVTQDTNAGTADFKIYHGPTEQGNTGLWFSSDIVAVCRAFLKAHPSETIVMSVKDEFGSTDDFEKNLKLHLTDDICLYDREIPTLLRARGRIVLVRRYEFGNEGIPARKRTHQLNTWWRDDIPDVDWPNDETGTITLEHQSLSIQDIYGFGLFDMPQPSVSDSELVVLLKALFKSLSDENKKQKIEKKWSFVQQHIYDASQSHETNKWWINFTSASGAPTILDPVNFAKGKWGHIGVNAKLNNYLKENHVKNSGAVLMDFPEYPNDGELIRNLIHINFK